MAGGALTTDPGPAPGHLDEHGEPCSSHPPVRPDVLVTLALIGSRASGFNHDLASKLQGLMMTIEDLADRLADHGDPELHRAAAEAAVMAQEIAALVTVSRQLTRSSPPTRSPLRELIAASCERAGVELATELVEAEVDLAAPHVIHALSLAIEVAAGPGRGRALDATCRLAGGQIELVLAAEPQTTGFAGEYLALASAILRREGGDVRCGAGRLVILLPSA
jgi:hypothetical protein